MTANNVISVRRNLSRLAGGALLLGSVSLLSAGCSEDPGPAEEAGRAIDEATESTTNDMERARREAEAWAESAHERAEENLDEMREQTSDAIDDMRDRTQAAIDEAEAEAERAAAETRRRLTEG